MAKLYPPQINGTIPAFYSNIKRGTTDMVVPFSMNRAVSFSEISGFIIQIKTLNGSLIGTVPSESYDSEELIATFNVRDYAYRFTLGSYYKVQLAYIEKDTNEIGYYSTVGVIKYTSYPTVIIDGLQLRKTNPHQQDYVGVYSQKDGDATEKLYSSYFVIYDEETIFYQSEEKLHNNTNDTERNVATESLRFLKSLEPNKFYKIEFFITTTNGLTAKSPKYRIAQKRLIDPSIHAQLKATLNYDNGYILLYLEDTEDVVISGSFLISRASNLNNYTWEPIRDFSLQSIRPNKWSFKDCTIEQGAIYKYSIQQFNSNSVYSSRIESNLIEVDFEDAFLFDGERQLRIRFNPKISSFKTDLQEQKTDTIGHQYPYFTRNSHIYYKEFPISGLISYLSDENELFIKKSELKINLLKWNSSDKQDFTGVPKQRKSDFYEITTNLTANNFISERTFKMTVLQWLNNGKPKLFRSPGEGNYLVRLMNVSLSPTDSLSRMLHTFSCTAYEVNNCSLETLSSYEIYDRSFSNELSRQWGSINIEDYIDDLYQQLAYKRDPIQYSKQQWRAQKEAAKTSPSIANDLISLKNSLREEFVINNKSEWINIINGQELPEIFVTDMMPGSMIRINEQEIIIGTTGSYRVASELNPFTSLEINIFDVPSGIITYSYEAQASNMFEIIESVNVSEVPCFQAIGRNLSRQIPIYNEDGAIEGEETTYNLLQILQDCKKSILNISQLKAIKRPIVDIILDEFNNDSLNDYSNIIFHLLNSNLNNFHFTLNGETYNMNEASNKDLNPLYLYQIRAPRLVKNVRLDYFAHDTSQLPPPLVEISKFHIYKDNQPFTFEQYYIDKNMDLFCPYTGFFFDALTGKVIQATDDLFTFQLDDEIIDISDIETWKVRQLAPQNLTTIIPNDGVYLELSYSQSTSIYQFDSVNKNGLRDDDLLKQRTDYEKTLGFYLIYRNQGYNKETMDQIKECAPILYEELKTNKENVFNKLLSINVTVYENGEWTEVHQDMKMYMINGVPNPYASDDDNIIQAEFNAEEYRANLKYLESLIKKLYEQYVNNLNQALEKYRKDNEMI